MERLFTFFLGCIVLGLALGDATDFRVYHSAALRLWQGGWPSVYDATALTPFKYHPVTALFFLPWAVLPFGVAKGVWALVQGALLWDVKRRMGRPGRWGVSTGAFLLACLFVIHAFTWQLKFANLSIVMAWGLFLVADLATPGRSAGALAALILFKPTWMVSWAVVLLGGIFEKAHRARALQTAFWTLVLLLLLSALLLPWGWFPYQAWWQTLADPTHAHNYPKNDNQSWYALAFRWGQMVPVGWSWLMGVALYAGVYLGVSWKCAGTFRGVVLTSALLWIWSSPLSWIHHQLVLIPFFAVIFSEMDWKPWTRGHVFLLVSWLALNGTGELFLGRALFTQVHQSGIVLLGLVAMLFLLPRFYKHFSGGHR